MRYLDRFKARQQQVGTAYAITNDSAPRRPLAVDNTVDAQAVNVLVDVILACRMKGLDYAKLRDHAEEWADYEWEQIEPLVEAARAARQVAA